jgi:hypothetical protein
VRLESSGQGAELRCVILTDLIRKAEMPKSTGEVASLRRHWHRSDI